MADYEEPNRRAATNARSASRSAPDQSLARVPRAQGHGSIAQLLNARPAVVAQRLGVERLSAAVTARSRFHDAVSKASAEDVGTGVVQRAVAVDAGAQTQLWNQWYAAFAAGNDPLTEAINEASIHLSIVGDADADDPGRTQVAWDADAQVTTIDIEIETGEGIEANAMREALGHELYLHAVPAIITHYNAVNQQEVPEYADPEDEEAFDAEEEAEHHNMDQWLQLFASSVQVGDQDLRDRVIVDFLTHGNDLHALMAVAIAGHIITAQLGAQIEQDFAEAGENMEEGEDNPDE